MSLIKGIVKYIFILLLIVLGVGVVAGAIMMIFNVSIFGYKYVSVNEKQTYYVSASPQMGESYFEHLDKLREVEIDAGNVDVTITPNRFNVSDFGYIRIYSIIQGNGIAKIEDKEIKDCYTTFKPTIETLYSNGTPTEFYKLIIKNETVDGLVNLTHHKIDVAIPNDLATKLFNLTIRTRGGDINIQKDGEEPNNDTIIKVSDTTTLETTYGNMNMRYIDIENLDAKSISGKMTFCETIGNINGVVKIKNQTGRVVFEEGVNFLSSCQIESGISRIKINDIVGAFEYRGESAYLDIGHVTGSVNIYSTDAVVNINEISGPSSRIFAGYSQDARDNPNHIGNRIFRIKKADFSEALIPDMYLETNSGEIRIDELITKGATNVDAMASLLTESGNITIGKLVGDVQATSKRGNIKINQGTYSDYPTLTEVLKSSEITVKNTSGNITLKNIVGALNVNVKTDGNSPIDVEILEVNNDITIAGYNGNANIKLPTTKLDNTANKYAFIFKNANDKKADGGINIDLLSIRLASRDYYYYVQYLNPETEDYYGDTLPEGFKLVRLYTKGGNISISQSR